MKTLAGRNGTPTAAEWINGAPAAAENTVLAVFFIGL
jgi:hypothetical protein